ncbi:MAG: SdrD B-like domain-containing protein [Pseudomonadota bacterium]
MTNVTSNTGQGLGYVTIDFNGLAAGTVVGSQFEGVEIIAQRSEDGGLTSTSENDAMIFDTANPTGGDSDLFTTTQGSALIISEDNDSSDPDDEAHGGSIQFKFDDPVSIKDLTIVDADHGGVIQSFDSNGELISEVTIPRGIDGDVRSFTVDADDVAALVITFVNSGAVDDLRYLPPVAPEPELASVGGTVFLDRNDDSVENAGDSTVQGVGVVLITNKGAVVGRTTTDALGNYLFADVVPGAGYRVLFEEVDGTTFVDANVGADDTIDSDVFENCDYAKTERFDLAAGEDKRDLDAGVELIDTATASISGTYFMDSNDNAVADAGDMAVSSAQVELLLDGQVVATTTTDANGDYLFENLTAGTYQVRFASQDGKEFVEANVGADETADSDVTAILPDAGLTETLDLAIGEHRPNVDAGVALPAPVLGALEGRVFCDTDLDGIDNQTNAVAGEELIVNGDFASHTIGSKGWGLAEAIEGWVATDGLIEVQQRNYGTGNTNGNEVVELDANRNSTIAQALSLSTSGTYSFSIDYAMRGTNPDTNGVLVYIGEKLIAELFPTASGFQTFEATLDLPAGETSLIIKGAGVSDSIGTVIDNVSLKQVSATEASKGKAGVTVKLIDMNGLVVATTETDADGNYRFDDVPEGDYQVMFTALDGTEFTLLDAGTDDTIDSDADDNGMTGKVTVVGGETTSDVDAGLKNIPLASVGGTVFMDNNDNSVEDTGDMVQAGVEVILTRDGTEVARTTTDANGDYLFDGLTPADGYRVFFADVDGKTFVDPNVGGDDTVDSDALVETGGAASSLFSLSPDEDKRDVDAGIELLDTADASLTGRVFMDVNDDSIDNDEMGVEGVEVTLLTAAGAPIATTTTGADGSYEFTGLTAGGYRVSFPTEFEGKTLVDANVGTDNFIDSDASQEDGITGTVFLKIGERITDIDAGLEVVDTADAALEGRVFMDVNDDSIDNGEMGVANVQVTLFSAAGAVVATTTTAADGSYAFEGLTAGGYRVEFPTEFEGKTLVEANVGTNNFIDSDASQDDGKTGTVFLQFGDRITDIDAGLELVDTGDAALAGRVFMDVNGDAIDNSEMGVAGVVVDLLDADGELVDTTVTEEDGSYAFTGLMAGDYIVDFPVEFDGKTIVAQDAGADDAVDSDASVETGRTAVVTLAIGEQSTDNDAGLELVDTGDASLAGRVFLDANQDDVDNAEEGVAGVTVTLQNAAGDVIATTETRESGSYEFTGLLAGVYVVVFPTEVNGLTLVGQNVGANDVIDSDASQSNGRTGEIVLGIGERSVDNDAGLELVDPANASLAGRVFFDANQNDVDNNEAGVAGVVVDLLDADGELVDTTVTSEDGSYAFTNLAAGDYIVDFPVEVDGATIVGQNAGTNDAVDSDASETTGRTDVISLAISEQSIDNDAGLEIVDTNDASLAGRIFLDANDNRVDNSEKGVGGVTVQLLNAAGAVVAETQTGNNGAYLFEDLGAGTYRVAFPTELDGLKLVGSNAGTNDAIDSDASQTTGQTTNVALAIGQSVTDIDAGFVSHDPIVGNDSGKICADKKLTINVLSNDTDDEALTITKVGGRAIEDGQTVTIDGVNVTLKDGKLTFDGKSAFEDLNVGEQGTARIEYTVSDGKGGEATGNVDLTFCGVADTLVEMHASLPEVATFKVLGDDLDNNVDGEAYSIILDNTGDARFDGKLFENAYCISLLDPVIYAEVAKDSPSHNGEISGGDDFVFNANQVSYANGKSAGENLDLINWIINQDYTNTNSQRFNDWEVQRAIWELTDKYDTSVLDGVSSGYGQDADVDWIVQQAIKNGEGFQAGKGDIATMIVDPGDSVADHTQPFIIAFDFDSNDCIC